MLEKFIDNDVMGFERVLRDLEKILLLIRINTLHIDRSFGHRQLLTDVNYFPAYMASRLNCGVSCLNSTIELLDMLIAAHYKRETSTRTSSD